MISETRRMHYLSQLPPIRLGSLAADLARIASFVKIPAVDAISDLLNESRAFIEWTAPEMSIDDAVQLVDIQRGLTHWRFAWPQVQNDSVQRLKLAEQAQMWSDQVLAMSGLLNED